ncbi:MAG: tetratricopeptide repeat protein [Phaeodactylibacter sp.]|nr:tetratricopeptide repeat protein [Phaeodactylibacter sp.]MCB9289114.1 tetratricopeptide repeat protein [Lewinellaceae bacterium]
MLRLCLPFLFFLTCALPARSAKYFAFTPAARQAYELATSLRFGEAYASMAQMKLEDPNNLIVHHIENYIDFFTLYIQEDEATYRKLRKNRDLRLEKVKAGDRNSPYYLFVQADIRLQWALVRLRFEDYLGAFTEVSKAYKLLKENEELFPGFMPNKKDLGILHAMVGTIPDSYKWGIKLLSGLDGTITQGRREVEEVLAYSQQNDFIFREETVALYAYLLLHLDNEGEEAWRAVAGSSLRPGANPMHCFVMANIAMRTGRNEQAIKLLEQRKRGKTFFPFPYLDYMLGLAKLRRLDHDATPHFQRFILHYQGSNFIKEAYQKMAWQELINGNPKGYERYMQACLANGSPIAGGDKNAQQEAEHGTAPDLTLLKARLLFDGGYFLKGYRILADRSPENFSYPEGQLEYYYRMGRLLHGLNRYDEALQYYQFTIEKGAGSPHFYACNAALQMGLIHESKGAYPQARAAFERCLNIEPEEYRTGLHQKAKSGLARIEEKGWQ